MTRLSCAEALRLARETIGASHVADYDDSHLALAAFVERVLSAAHSDDPNAILYAVKNAMKHRGPKFCRAMAAALLRAADEAEGKP